MSKKDFGGRIAVRFSSGELISLRGTLNIMPTRNSSGVIVNQDGKPDRTLTPEAPSAEINFADRGIKYDDLINADRFNVTIDEDDTDVTHYFTQAFLVGRPTINRLTGEVTGLTIVAEKYTRR